MLRSHSKYKVKTNLYARVAKRPPGNYRFPRRTAKKDGKTEKDWHVWVFPSTRRSHLVASGATLSSDSRESVQPNSNDPNTSETATVAQL